MHLTLHCTLHLIAENSNIKSSTKPTPQPPPSLPHRMVKEERAALTGQILQTDASASDIMLPSKDSSSSSSGWRSKRFLLEAGTILLLLALLGTVVGLAVGLSRSNQNRGLDPACIHALGGGPVKSGGSIDTYSARLDSDCKQQLRTYADRQRGSYFKEVDLAMLAAMSTFGFAHRSTGPLQQQQQQQQQPAQQQPSQLQDTAAGLATQADLQQAAAANSRFTRSLLQGPSSALHQTQAGPVLQLGSGPATAAVGYAGGALTLAVPEPGPDKVVVFDIDETVLSNLPQILDPETWPWPKWVEAAKAPALKPTLRFYNSLCDAGYSVAFITGRKEDSRNSTMRNLEAAGYGKPCKPGPGPFYGVRPAGSRECCYAALYLRAPGDTRLASVYKPGARKDLLAKGGSGMSLVALVGDQFSDLNGEESAPFAFLLPNSFYYIL